MIPLVISWLPSSLSHQCEAYSALVPEPGIDELLTLRHLLLQPQTPYVTEIRRKGPGSI